MTVDLYEQRRSRLRRRALRDGTDAFLITNVTNVSYLTGFSGDDSWLLLFPDGALLLSDSRYEEQISEECPGLDAHIRNGKTSMFETVRRFVEGSRERSGIQELGVEAESMTLSEFLFLQDKLKRVRLMPLEDYVEQLREIKDRTEIAAIKDALQCTRRSFEMIRNGLRPEQTEIDIANELDYNMRRLGADALAFPSIVAMGARAALPHAMPTNRSRVQDSDLLLIDWGARKNSYVGDLTRVLITTSKPSAKLRSIYKLVLKAQKAAIQAIKPGVLSCDIDHIARAIIEKGGYGSSFGHGLGHGLGRLVHERGGFRVSNDTPLRPGMVLSVEPGIYLPGWGGVRIEDDILVTKDGCEVLSEGFPKEFDEMIVSL